MVERETGKPSPLPKKFVPPRIQLAPDYQGYTCPITNRWVEGRRAHQENLKRHGCRVFERGEREAAAKDRADADRKIESTVNEAVERTVAQHF